MQFHFRANQGHFHKNGFAFRLALKQRHKGTRKWPIAKYYIYCTSGDVENYYFEAFLAYLKSKLSIEKSKCKSQVNSQTQLSLEAPRRVHVCVLFPFFCFVLLLCVLFVFLLIVIFLIVFFSFSIPFFSLFIKHTKDYCKYNS